MIINKAVTLLIDNVNKIVAVAHPTLRRDINITKPIVLSLQVITINNAIHTYVDVKCSDKEYKDKLNKDLTGFIIAYVFCTDMDSPAFDILRDMNRKLI